MSLRIRASATGAARACCRRARHRPEAGRAPSGAGDVAREVRQGLGEARRVVVIAGSSGLDGAAGARDRGYRDRAQPAVPFQGKLARIARPAAAAEPPKAMPAPAPAVSQAKPAPAVEQPVVAAATPKPEPKPASPPADNLAKRAPVSERPVAAEPSQAKPA